MKYLLDVNVLLALALRDHVFHERVANWMKLATQNRRFSVATCSVTELAFIRILSQPVYGYSVNEAGKLLEAIKGIPDLNFIFMADSVTGVDLPSWVTAPSQVTDGHLITLAEANRAKLATLDEKILTAFTIPK